jgi:hypothetical protein
VSDTEFTGLKYKVKTLNERFYIAQNSFDSLILQKKIYEHKYEFDNNCRYKSIEKQLFHSEKASEHDSTYVQDSIKRDSIQNPFPHAFKEPEYCLTEYTYVSDSVTVLKIYNKNRELMNYVNKKYKNNKLISEENYSASDRLISKTGFWYAPNGKLTNKTVFYDGNYSEIRYRYSTGKKLEIDNEYRYGFEFDINGNLTDKKTYKGVSPVCETHFYYNEYNDLIMTQDIGNDGNVMKTLYEYVYDSKNNWTTCVEYNHTGNIFVRTREITYYD